ncbi:hypothetical protein MPNT_340012 [Candidatus Methylacidithermus pantelleriae]|uniref:Uncharacterized protein n=1 Tax=Candidatus Methylacidithermus pantelleriae TaxID=2744239 RepID=A0A8J2BMU3_9BACT|nr:hypothetical protein MPNT_340012 [Candidatus Methylacidithermus pantelleriae]
MPSSEPTVVPNLSRFVDLVTLLASLQDTLLKKFPRARGHRLLPPTFGKNVSSPCPPSPKTRHSKLLGWFRNDLPRVRNGYPGS